MKKAGVRAIAALALVVGVAALYWWSDADVKPPSATLVVDGQEQMGGLSGYTWSGLSGGRGNDLAGIVTPLEPLKVAVSPLIGELRFSLQVWLKQSPQEVFMDLGPVTPDDELEGAWTNVRIWQSPRRVEWQELLPARRQQVELALEPGLNVVRIFVRWGRGDASYGFLVEMAEA
ncbi:MAG: hypothetical protein HY532_06125 [Chloroflexi bacterium]|nr:hypothetical protein [Chloroflexota bacterium]